MLTLKVDDLTPLIASFHAFADGFQRDVRELNRSTAADALATARQVAPQDTGYMFSQLKMEFSDDGLSWSVGWDAEDFIGKINPFDGKLITVFYPVFSEFGTVSSPAHPTLEPTFASIRPEYLADLRELNREAVARFGRG